MFADFAAAAQNNDAVWPLHYRGRAPSLAAATRELSPPQGFSVRVWARRIRRGGMALLLPQHASPVPPPLDEPAAMGHLLTEEKPKTAP
jgi:hypothetical protein